jgi:transcriptional regulator with XRE-family HTH domain
MPEDDEQRPLLDAIRAALEERNLSQRELGAAVAHIEGQPAYPQSTVGAWLQGKAYLRPSRVFAIERVMGMRPGTLAKLDGYLPLTSTAPPTTVEEALAADPDITSSQAVMLAAGVEAMRNQTRERRSSR